MLVPGGTVEKCVPRDVPEARLVWRRYSEAHTFRCDRCEKDLTSKIVVERRPLASMVVDSICNGCYGELVAGSRASR